MNRHLFMQCLAFSATRTLLIFIAGTALVCALSAGPCFAAAEPKLARELLTITPDEAMTEWRGDLDGMIERRR